MVKARDNNVWAPVAPNFARHEDIFWSNGDRVNMMRTFLRFGAPIDIVGTNFSSSTDRLEDQKKHVADFQQKIVTFLDEQTQKYDYDGFEAFIYSNQIRTKAINDQSIEDVYWAAGSVGFVTLYFMVTFRSIILGSFAILLVLLSFPVA